MWRLDHKEDWALKNFWLALDKTLESQMYCKDIEPVNPKGNQLWLFIGRTEARKLGLQYSDHRLRRANSLEMTLTLGKIEGKRRRRWQRMKWLDSITDSVDMNLSKLWEIVKDRGACFATVHGIAKGQTYFRNLNNNNRIWIFLSSLYSSHSLNYHFFALLIHLSNVYWTVSITIFYPDTFPPFNDS